ncbi:protein sprint-like [Ptychodera flava]|uniref:protein sprint-like n=1 Tax=Ptychodera flava TaxID=63121 RepID=UPI00396A4889
MAAASSESQLLNVDDVDDRVAMRRSSYMEILGNIANELDMMLDDLCDVFPDANGDTGKPSSPTTKSRQISNEEFEDYISCADEIETTDMAVVMETSEPDDANDVPVFLEEQAEASTTETISSTTLETLAAGVRNIDLIDRLVQTHPIWYQPSTCSVAVLHMLQAQRPGSFILHKSIERNSMTLAVRVLEGSQFKVANYTIQSTNSGVKLVGCDKVFDSVPKLIGHLCEFQECLPTQLVLPVAILHANSTQELSALGFLGPDFWTSSMNRSATLSASDLARMSMNNQQVIRTEILVPISENTQEETNMKDQIVYDSENDGFTTTVQDPLTEKLPLERRSNTLPAGHKLMTPLFPDVSSPSDYSVGRPLSLTLSPLTHKNNDIKKRYPAPDNSPPPPPSNEAPAIRTATQIAIDEEGEIAGRYSGDYYKPFEATKQDHLPPSSFGMYVNQLPISLTQELPPLPPKPNTTMETAPKMNQDAYNSPSTKTNVISDPWTPAMEVVPKLNQDAYNSPSTKTNVICDPWTPAMEAAPKLNQDAYNSASTKTNVISDPWTPATEVVPKLQLAPKLNPNAYNLPSTKTNVISDPWTPATSDQAYGIPQNTMSQTFMQPSVLNSVDSVNKIDRISYSSDSTTSSQSRNSNSFTESTVGAESKSTGASPVLDSISNTSTEKRNSVQPDDSNTNILDTNIPSHCSDSTEILQPFQTHSSNIDIRSSLDDFDPLVARNSADHSDHNNQLRENEHVLQMFNRAVRLEESIVSFSERHDSAMSFTSRESMASSIFSRDSVFTDTLEKNVPYPSDFSFEDVNIPMTRSRTTHVSITLSPKSGTSSATQFSDPWDSSLWELDLGDTKHQPKFAVPSNDDVFEGNKISEESPQEDTATTEETAEVSKQSTPFRKLSRGRDGTKNGGSRRKKPDELTTSIFYVPVEDEQSHLIESEQKENQRQQVQNKRRSSGFGAVKQKIKKPFLAVSPRRKQGPSGKIQSYIIKTSTNMNTTFGSSVTNFIQCTKESPEINPSVVMRNVRQFMDGMKHYLLQEDLIFQAILTKEIAKMPSEEPISEDAIIEGALHKCIIKPLKSHMYKCLLTEYSRNGSIQLLNKNLKAAKSKSCEELGVRPVFIPPQGASLNVLMHFFNKMYKAYSPLSKMDCLLKAVSTIYKSTQDTRPGHEAVHSMGADDFLPVFIYVLAHCDVKTAEIDADYMQGLLEPNLLLGQGGYYLTTLISAVYVIKNLHLEENNGETNALRLPCISDMQGFLKISFLDAENGALMSKTLPITPSMTTADVCQLIAGKLDIDNANDFALFVIVDGEERQLLPEECPQQLKADLHLNEKHYLFGYRSKYTTVAWQSHM